MIELLVINAEKFKKALALLNFSVRTLPDFQVQDVDDPEKMIPFDALFSRFERLVQVAIGKCFRSIEIHQQAPATTNVRNRLSLIAKIGIISSVELWMEIREFCNKIAHDYLPDQISKTYESISRRFLPEFVKTQIQIETFLIKAKETCG